MVVGVSAEAEGRSASGDADEEDLSSTESKGGCVGGSENGCRVTEDMSAVSRAMVDDGTADGSSLMDGCRWYDWRSGSIQ